MAEQGKGSVFSAADPALGYLYQIRLALLCSLRKMRSGEDFRVSIEAIDDVAFEGGADTAELLQTKHHRSKKGNLGDASPDIWKTLRVWCEGSGSGLISSSALLYLVTTSEAADGSAAFSLRDAGRDVARAKQALDATAMSSTNPVNTPAYAAYLKMTDDDRLDLIERVVVLDGAPSIAELGDQLRSEVYWAAERTWLSAFLERLEGWWLRRVLRHLREDDSDRITSVEIEAKMSDLREQFRNDGLPIDDDLLLFTLDEVTARNYGSYPFVKQIEIANAAPKRVSAAIRDYYRAYEQRSRWLREELVGTLDLTSYETRLVEEWELVFEAIRDELGDAATDAAKESAARAVLTWAEGAPVPIRSGVDEPFVGRGSLHILADELRVGWHPEFRDRFASVLQESEKAAS